jgi:3-hydroxy-9,10-secoandrosta-1,3,5(10)-triene-9,17-dione monooxygenase
MLDNALTTGSAQSRRNNGQFATTSQAPAAAVLSRVNEILPQLRSRASETEKLRRMHPGDLAQLTEAGVFNLTRPADVGGYEADDHIVTEVLTQVARACPSTSWICTIMLASNLLPALLNDEVADDIYGTPDLRITGTIAPTGEATTVKGGYRVSGRWAWNTGGVHSNWVAPTCLTGTGPTPTPIMVIVPAAQVQHQDTWYAAGMAGTATNVMELHDVFVPVSRTLRIEDLTDGPLRVTTLHRQPVLQPAMVDVRPRRVRPDTARHGTGRDGCLHADPSHPRSNHQHGLGEGR